MGSRNTPSSPCPTSLHRHVELLQTFPLDFLLRTALHCGSKQPFQYLALDLLCILLLLFSALPSAFFYSFYLCSFWYSFPYFYCLTPDWFLCGIFFFFLCFFSTRKGRYSTPAQFQSYKGELEIRQEALLLSGYAGRGLGFCGCVDFPEVILELVQQFTVKGLQF